MSDVVNKKETASLRPLDRIVLTEEQKGKPIWELLDEVLPPIPPEEWNRIPHDGAENHDHYLYETPNSMTPTLPRKGSCC